MTATTTPRPTWTETATERLLDVATMAIAYLYWQICEMDGRVSLIDSPPEGHPNRSRHSASIL